jgi:hypothetical protein
LSYLWLFSCELFRRQSFHQKYQSFEPHVYFGKKNIHVEIYIKLNHRIGKANRKFQKNLGLFEIHQIISNFCLLILRGPRFLKTLSVAFMSSRFFENLLIRRLKKGYSIHFFLCERLWRPKAAHCLSCVYEHRLLAFGALLTLNLTERGLYTIVIRGGTTVR